MTARGDTPAGAGGAVEEAQRGLEAARGALALATDARARAVYDARRAGVSLGRLAALLGVSRPAVVQLAARGAGVVEVPVPPADVAIPPRGPGVTGATGLVDEKCLRESCPFPAVEGRRFCQSHQWN